MSFPHQIPPNKKPENSPKKSPWRNFLIIVLLLTGLTFAFGDQVFQEQTPKEEIPLSVLQEMYQQSQLKTIEIKNEEATATTQAEPEKKIYAIIHPLSSVKDLGFDDATINQNTEVKYVSTQSSEFWKDLVSRLIPFLFIVALFFFMMRGISKGASGAFSFGKSKDRMFKKGGKQTKFKDVAGCEEAKQELEEIVEFLKSPKRFTKMGAKIPKGVLLMGSPGTGKTLLARAVAGEADVPFFSISGSEFVEMFVGVGASRVRDLFSKAKKNAPAIIFIDEIDAVGKQRGQGMGGGHDEREQTLNQILTEMDGFDNEASVIVMASTNRPDVLDKALLRPGRFDRRVPIDLPQLTAREEILNVHAKGKPLAKSVDLLEIARITPGFSGADLENLMNEAAIYAAREKKKTITRVHLNKAHERIVLGLEKRSLLLSEDEKKNTAYHETGHAIISHVLPKGDPVRKVTIIPRGMALGVTYNAPDKDEVQRYFEKYFSEICIFMGGQAAERIIFGDYTSGASNDIRQATKIARNMVMRFGMSPLGPMELGSQEHDFFGGEIGTRAYSEQYAAQIDRYVQRLLQCAMQIAHAILEEYDEQLHEVAALLMKRETITQEEFEQFFERDDRIPQWKFEYLYDEKKQGADILSFSQKNSAGSLKKTGTSSGKKKKTPTKSPK